MTGSLIVCLLLAMTVPSQGARTTTRIWEFGAACRDGYAGPSTLEIARSGDSYTGRVLTTQGIELPLDQLVITEEKITAVASLSDTALMVITLTREGEHRFVARWVVAPPQEPLAITGYRNK